MPPPVSTAILRKYCKANKISTLQRFVWDANENNKRFQNHESYTPVRIPQSVAMFINMEHEYYLMRYNMERLTRKLALVDPREKQIKGRSEHRLGSWDRRGYLKSPLRYDEILYRRQLTSYWVMFMFASTQIYCAI